MMHGKCSVKCAVLRGVEATPVDVEVSISRGMPGFFIVGMADAAVQESRERIKSALFESGFSMPRDRVLVNLAPSSLKKNGSGFDLAIAVGVLVASGQLDSKIASYCMFAGELSLNGHVRSIGGLLAYALCSKMLGYALVCSSDAEGLLPIKGVTYKGITHLRDLREGKFSAISCQQISETIQTLDYGDISGNERAKRAFQIAAAGQHGVLMMGPPGSGKTMLASRMPSILPPLEENEKYRAALTYSVAGEDINPLLKGIRPFRSPHHSATAAGLIGGGNPVRPGEISLADTGVLFLDELSEFKSSVLQQIRQPLESGEVIISRADGSISFPAKFMLIAASNPCPCGFFGDPEKKCTCSPAQISRYQNRIGGPLLDRIDMHLDVKRVPPGEVLAPSSGTSSKELLEGVMRGREYASWRKKHYKQDRKTLKRIMSACNMEEKDLEYFKKIARTSSMSGRSILRTLSLARTIADINESKAVKRNDLCEALTLRLRCEV